MGRIVQPVFEPLGYDWQLTIGVLTSFIAREVFVSTMSVLAGDLDAGVISTVRAMPRDDGTPVFRRATSASALVFSCSRCSACRRSP
jgi:ferrous iron transport protein B